MQKFIKEKLAEINKTREQIVANLNILAGKEMAYNALLAELKKQETAELEEDEAAESDAEEGEANEHD